MKYDKYGNLVWQNIYNSSSYRTVFQDITIDSDHNLYVTGWIDYGMDQDLFLAKFNSNGTLLWNQTWDAGTNDQDLGQHIALDSNNNIYIAGDFINLSVSGYRALFLKFDPTGIHLWNMTWINNNETSWGEGIEISGNNMYVSGRSNAYGYKSFLTKYDLDGNLIWNRNHNAPYFESRFTLDSSGNAYLIRDTGYSGHVQVVKYDSDGNILWNTTFGSHIRDWPYDVVVDENEYVYIAGMAEVNITINFDFLFAILNPDGTLLWNTTWGRTDCREMGESILLDDELNTYLIGYIYNVSEDASHAFVAKFNVTVPEITPPIPGFQFIFVLFPLFLIFIIILVLPKSRRKLFVA